VSPDRHLRFHELLAERLDGPLPAREAADLQAHLAACPACRVVERDYTAQHEQLRALSAIDPPRDLWARTRAAIDHEVAREGRRPFPAPTLELDRPGAHRQLRVAIGSLVGVLVALLLVGGPLAQGPIPEVASATPFAIPPQQLAFLDVADGQLTLYRADVAEVCPPPGISCAAGPPSRPVVRLGGGVAARELALGGGGQLFIAGRDPLGAEIFAIIALPVTPSPEPTPSPTMGPDGSAPPSTPTEPTPTATEPVVEPSGDPTATPTARPTDGPDGTPGTGSDAPSITPPPTSGQPATAEAHPILSDMRGTGAPAAWSPEGTILALSAMPADGSAGSDVYTWRPGDEQAVPLTSDHHSTFASWAGDRIVVSRIAAADDASADAAALTTTTVVIDPTSGEERAVELADAWLPSVDPTRHWVVYWQGRLEAQEEAVLPAGGRLFIAGWSAIDPWAADDAAAAAAASPSGVPATSPGDQPVASDAPPPGPRPTATVAPEPTPGDVGGADERPAPAGSPGGSPSASGSPDASLALDQPRAVSGSTSDWVVRWSTTGTAYGIWTRVEREETGGTLIVRSVPGATNPEGEVLVAPTPAQRSFAVGADRVVWVTPLPGGDGELWVASWGELGNGSLRLRTLDSAEALPAF
jgi:hypothetical protein